MVALPAGILANLRRLADETGRFRMLAVDQRDSMRRMLAGVLGRAQEKVTYDDLATTKAIITQVLAPHSTATLMDPVYGLPYSLPHLPARTGILIAAEETGYQRAGPAERERTSRLIEGWSAQKAQRAGANAVKLLIYYRSDASLEVRSHQEALVRDLGCECTQLGLPFLLEVVAYPIGEPSTDSPEFALKRPDLVADSAQEFSKAEYQVDILKLEFPGDLKYTQEFCHKVFDDRLREPVYQLTDLQAACRRVDEASALPWVILSGGVDIQEFLHNLELAVEAGASGFLCGRAIWKDVLQLYPDLEEMRAFLASEGRYNFQRANAGAEKARPWHDHPRFTGQEKAQLAAQGPTWYQEF
ncbi:MAG: tagatose 1,6-diphosphate aldolase [Dehalococcoidia bacterium]